MTASDWPGSGPEAWEYDVLAVAETGGVSLRHIAFDIFAREGLVEAFNIPEERFKALLERLELLYSVENPYHCALHAAVRDLRAARSNPVRRRPALPVLATPKNEQRALGAFAPSDGPTTDFARLTDAPYVSPPRICPQDVLAATHCLHKGLPPGVFDPVEVLALYLSALGHDAGHFRLNNAFLKNSKHALYKKHPESILEHFHLRLLFELLEDEDVGIVAFLQERDKARFRDLVATLILATDMAKHMGLFKRLQAFLADARATHRETTWMRETARGDGTRREGDLDRGFRVDGDASSASGDDEGSPRSSLAGTPRTSANLDAPTRGSPDRDSSRDSEDGRTHESWVRPAIDGANVEQRVLVM